jgi:hypothetical protein
MSSEETARFPKEYEETRERVLEILKKGKPQEAYSILLTVLDYPMEIEDDLVFKDALMLFEKIARKISGQELGDLVRNVVDNIDDIQALFDLSYELYEENQHGLAATLLSRANQIEPQDAHIIPELVSNLEELMMNGEARRVLLEAKDLLDESELCRYLLAYNSLMTGNLKEPFEIVQTLQDVKDDNIKAIVESFEGMLNRAKLLKETRPLDNKDLRGWHAVLNGSLLLHCSPFGDDAMNGRYAYISDSYTLCREGIERLGDVIKEAGITIPCIYSLENRSSKILALATSEFLGIPLKQWNGDSDPGLIVVYDIEEIESEDTIIQIADHRPGQVLWVHASCWTYPFPFSPDITTFLYQMKTTPWDGSMTYDKEAKNVKRADPDKSPVEEIAGNILNAVKDKDYLEDLEDLLSIVNELKDLEDERSKLGIFKSHERRNRQRIGSPVPSNRFL